MRIISALLSLLSVVCYVSAMTYQQALEQMGNSPLLTITDKNAKQYIKNEDYSLIVFLTAGDPRVGCNLCTDFNPDYHNMAETYWKHLKESGIPQPGDENYDDNDKSRVIFAISDFLDAREYFAELGLKSVPRVFYYEPGKGPKMAEFSEEFFFVVENNLEPFQKWVSDMIPGLQINSLQFEATVSKASIFFSTITMVIILSGVYRFKKEVSLVLHSRKLWQGSSLLVIILFIAGHMFNQIRHTEMSKTDKDGNVIYFAQGHQQQLGVETQIISLIYGLLTFAVITLIQLVPKIENHKLKVSVTLFACIFVFFLYSYLIEAYRTKSPTYPLHLFKFS